MFVYTKIIYLEIKKLNQSDFINPEVQMPK